MKKLSYRAMMSDIKANPVAAKQATKVAAVGTVSTLGVTAAVATVLQAGVVAKSAVAITGIAATAYVAYKVYDALSDNGAVAISTVEPKLIINQ